MGQNDLYTKLYGKSTPRPNEEREVAPHLKSRSGLAFLETLKNGTQSPDLPTSDTGSKPV